MIKKKKGVVIKGLKQPMRLAIDIAHALVQIAGVDLVITDAVRPAKPGKKSLHPEGLAIDFRTRDLPAGTDKIVYKALRQLLPTDYQILYYKTHIHIEYQRYLDDQRPITIDNDLPEVA